MPKTAKAIEHLWVIVAEIDTTANTAICVNVTSRRGHSDTTCILKAGDHRFVDHDSVINYSDAREMPLDLVEQALLVRTTQFVCKLHDPCKPEVLARIQQGLLDSKQTPKGIKAQCRKLWCRD